MKNPNTRVIVLDNESLRPMAWSGEQFCFVRAISLTSSRKSGEHITSYTRHKAIKLIKMDQEWRNKRGYTVTNFCLMLFKF